MSEEKSDYKANDATSSTNENAAGSSVISAVSANKDSKVASTAPKSQALDGCGSKQKSKVASVKSSAHKAKSSLEEAKKCKSKDAEASSKQSKAKASSSKDSNASKSKSKSCDGGSAVKCKSRKSKVSDDSKEQKSKKSQSSRMDGGSSHGKSSKSKSIAEEYKSKATHSSAEEKGGRHHKQHSKKKKDHRSETASATSLTIKERHSIKRNVLKVRECKGATSVARESIIAAAHYEVNNKNKVYQSDYSQVLRAKNTKIKSFGGLVVKMINLTECSPRMRVNLPENAVRIMRFVGGGGGVDEKAMSPPLSELFIKVYDVFLVSGVKLLIFMDECNASRLLYDLVKSPQAISHTDVRKWTKAIAAGVHELQRIGVAHRAIKLQHIMFDYSGKPKLCGWSKAVYYFQPAKSRILLQHKERRVRRNYHLPPEAFLGLYDPSKADIWSIGIILVAMATKRYPFTVRDSKTKFSSQWRAFVKKNELNTYARNLCHKIFIISPQHRISSGAILEDKYFTVANEKLAILNCKLDPNEVREDTRVGAVSAIELGSQKQAPEVPQAEPEVAAAEEEEAPAVTDGTGEEDGTSTGLEGGTVGEEENLPPEEQQAESQMAENAAPEEGEIEAQPEEGQEVAAIDADQEDAAAAGEEEEEAKQGDEAE